MKTSQNQHSDTPGAHARNGGRAPETSGMDWEQTRLVGVDLPRDKRMEIALTYIFGIGRTRSQ